MAHSESIQFKRRTLWAKIDIVLAFGWFAIAYFHWSLGDPLIAIISAVLATIMAVEAVWATRTPYALIDDQGIRVRDRLVGWWRYVDWSDVVTVEEQSSGVKLFRSGSAFRVRLGWVQLDQRKELIKAIYSHVKNGQTRPGAPNKGFNRTPVNSAAAKPGGASGGAG